MDIDFINNHWKEMVEKYGAMMQREETPKIFPVDAKLLPYPKEQLLQAFFVFFLCTGSKEMRFKAMDAIDSICRYQDGIGDSLDEHSPEKVSSFLEACQRDWIIALGMLAKSADSLGRKEDFAEAFQVCLKIRDARMEVMKSKMAKMDKLVAKFYHLTQTPPPASTS
ncbi:MAG TPA: hypothetical protein VGH19_07985 [Verrucomicrobiae bacterium]